MLSNTAKLDKFYQRLLRNEKLSHKKALSIYEMLYQEAVSLGAISSKNILDGLETDLRIARILNGLAG